MKKILLIIVLIICFGVSGCWEVSSGERVGIITKFSYKGVFWSTWEGEMMLGSSNSGSTWEFALDNKCHRGENLSELIKKIQMAADTGKRVKLIYKQEMVTAWWRSDNTHLIQNVIFLDDVKSIEKGKN
jgi:hypothetical protein